VTANPDSSKFKTLVKISTPQKVLSLKNGCQWIWIGENDQVQIKKGRANLIALPFDKYIDKLIFFFY